MTQVTQIVQVIQPTFNSDCNCCYLLQPLLPIATTATYCYLLQRIATYCNHCYLRIATYCYLRIATYCYLYSNRCYLLELLQPLLLVTTTATCCYHCNHCYLLLTQQTLLPIATTATLLSLQPLLLSAITATTAL